MKGLLGSWRWLVLGSALLVAVVLTGVTVLALALEREHLAARADAEHQTQLRLALWRLDSYVGPLLAGEASRPWYHYRPFVPQERAFTRMLNAIDPGEVIAPSPLLSFRSDLIPLHFEVDAQNVWTSPQAPTGNLLDLAQANLNDPAYVTVARARLDRLAAAIEPAALRAALSSGESWLAQIAEEEVAAPPASKSDRNDYGSRSGQQWRASQTQAQTLKSPVPTDPVPEVQVGPIVPLWLEVQGAPTLAYLRRVRTPPADRVQGFLVDWPTLRGRLLGEISELVDGARLMPEPEGSSSHSLATLPARLEGTYAQPPGPGWTPTRTALTALWLAAAGVLSALAFALRASVLYGERRARFASAVTHELRTPLTTFRMYSEMLAKGMVPPERETEYLETLRRESDRLSVLVENVLAYARLEDGRSPLRRERVPVGALLERLRPDLERRVDEAQGQLEIVVDATTAATQANTDPAAVQQILFNLVDNACKYGASPIRIQARCEADGVVLTVEDAGPGIPPGQAHHIFRPFDRGGRDESDGTPGVGLGLALARGLARDLGGDLELEPGGTRGARFDLKLAQASANARP
jgi:signal transduction histidine kinase